MDDDRSFDWHDAKSDQCLRERGFSFADIVPIFAGPLIEEVDSRKDYGEERVRAAGLLDGVPFMVVYTQRESVTWIISARRMHAKEWLRWHASH